jgi:Fur family ferric uptake transcriptional regulator
MSCQKTFFNQLRERGLRLTPQREMVLSVMHEMESFATAEEIYDEVHTLSSSVDISTIYRTLDLFQDFHVIAMVDPGDGQRRYKLADTNAPRLHLVCRACGKVIGVDLELAQPLVAYLKEQNGFAADVDRLSILGLCQECRAARD